MTKWMTGWNFLISANARSFHSIQTRVFLSFNDGRVGWGGGFCPHPRSEYIG